MAPAEVTVRSFNAAITAHDLDALSALITDEHRFVDSAGQAVTGRVAVLEAWSNFFSAFPDYRNEFHRVIVRTDIVVMSGDSHCTDLRLDGPALWTARVVGDKLSEWRVYEDTASTREALGLQPLQR